jgi:hypothetical protein
VCDLLPAALLADLHDPKVGGVQTAIGVSGSPAVARADGKATRGAKGKSKTASPRWSDDSVDTRKESKTSAAAEKNANAAFVQSLQATVLDVYRNILSAVQKDIGNHARDFLLGDV